MIFPFGEKNPHGPRSVCLERTKAGNYLALTNRHGVRSEVGAAEAPPNTVHKPPLSCQPHQLSPTSHTLNWPTVRARGHPGGQIKEQVPGRTRVTTLLKAEITEISVCREEAGRQFSDSGTFPASDSDLWQRPQSWHLTIRQVKS